MRKYRRRILGLTLALVAFSPAMADFARLGGPYDAAAFANAQAEDKIILVESYADWCLACRVQAPLLADVLREDVNSDVVMFRLQENSSKAAWKQFRLKYYGVMIAYRGSRETGRIVGAKTKAQIAALLATARN